jgi:molybdenum cofactor biosynthesis enzyme MoaA
MLKHNDLNSIDTQKCLVIDVTYKCNASCRYCQWGDNKNPAHLHQPPEAVLLPKETLTSLGTQRLVFSGGEPLLRNDLEQIVDHYSRIGLESVVTITNGILLSPARFRSLHKAGLTGVTFSIDSVDPKILRKSRAYSEQTCQHIIRHLNIAAAYAKKNGLEVGVNCVVNAANANLESMLRLVEFCGENDITTLKFSPIFDDGYAGRIAPDLLLRECHAESLRKIGEAVTAACQSNTNPLGFWQNVADLASGEKLLGSCCDLAERQALAIRGEIKFCAWLDAPIYGRTDAKISLQHAVEARAACGTATPRCRTGPWCFCLQKLNHVWKTS